MMKMNVRLADNHDIPLVTDLRMEYLRSVYSLNGKEPVIREHNCDYLCRNINKTCYVALGFADEKLCSCAYMTLIEKAANLRFIEGVYGEIYGVYTLPEYRCRGIATEVINILIAKGREIQLPYIQLEASADGYHLYKRLGFEETNSDYIDMKLFLKMR